MASVLQQIKEGEPIARNSFIQMSKLPNLKGRITYISSKAKQENLYAVYETTDRKFWRELAKCNQEEFRKSGTVGECIEARELIIALPESFVDYQPDMLLKLFTEHFKQNYGVECISALHHNKRKTNYHIHLIFSERKCLNEPVEKIASRNMFYDENGKQVRTKKEICNESGKIRDGCSIIKKGEVYERQLFTAKDAKFKNEGFLDEVKRSYTDLINLYVQDDKNKLKVFERGGVYLATKKIGKNNPKADRIEADNRYRKWWNETVDRALVVEVPEQQILAVKKVEISDKVRSSIQQNGSNPNLFGAVITMAVSALQLIIRQVIEKLSAEIQEPEETEQKQSEKTVLAEKYSSLLEINRKLNQQNYAIYEKEQQLEKLQKELANTKGLFKGKQRKELQGKIQTLEKQIANMKSRLSKIVQEYGYKTVQEFQKELKVVKVEYQAYQASIIRKEDKPNPTVRLPEQRQSVRERLREKQEKIKEREQKTTRTHSQKKDRGAR